MHPDAADWFAKRTSTWRDWPLADLYDRKGDTRISVVLPALDEEPTVAEIVTGARTLMPLVDEVIVVDSGSVDRTAEVARQAGATVHHRDDILPGTGSRPGKGEVLWKALAVATGDILVYVDADLTDFRPHFVTGLLGPLLDDPATQMVKAFYDRPLLDVSAGGGGRVTELAARPLLNAYFPALAGVVQPLAGEYAARRSLLESLPFAAGYGVETGLLIDTYRTAGLDAVAQVDLGQRTHGHQDTAALGRMAATILHTIHARITPGAPVWPTLTQFVRRTGTVTPADHPVAHPDRPPMTTIPGYRQPLA
ncbi:glucosyl-3-phosphoglycerate synthase [Dactylosporangium sp. NPDC050588]|uniref:glucosyl-3-phosphoglycerate synthase n=1 Tax=Dactylosporangium sp. NPDC050588 TaxID=3157211 RepID=UPI0033E4844F